MTILNNRIHTKDQAQIDRCEKKFSVRVENIASFNIYRMCVP